MTATPAKKTVAKKAPAKAVAKKAPAKPPQPSPADAALRRAVEKAVDDLGSAGARKVQTVREALQAALADDGE